MRTLLLLTLLWSTQALACWRLEGTLGVDGETFKLNQKIDHDKEYAFPMGSFILKLTVGKTPTADKAYPVTYVVHEKKGTTLTVVTKGTDELPEGRAAEIFAKGEPGQPNSILTLKLNRL